MCHGNRKPTGGSSLDEFTAKCQTLYRRMNFDIEANIFGVRNLRNTFMEEDNLNPNDDISSDLSDDTDDEDLLLPRSDAEPIPLENMVIPTLESSNMEREETVPIHNIHTITPPPSIKSKNSKHSTVNASRRSVSKTLGVMADAISTVANGNRGGQDNFYQYIEIERMRSEERERIRKEEKEERRREIEEERRLEAMRQEKRRREMEEERRREKAEDRRREDERWQMFLMMLSGQTGRVNRVQQDSSFSQQDVSTQPSQIENQD